MSDNIEVTTAQPEPVEAPAPVLEPKAPEQVQEQPKEGETPQGDAPESETEPKAEDGEGDQPKPKKPRGWVSERIGELTRDKYEANARAEEAKAEAARLRAELESLKTGQKPQQTAPAPDGDFDPFDKGSVASFVQTQIQTARQQWEAEQKGQTMRQRVEQFQSELSEADEGAIRVLTDTSFPLTDDMADFVIGSPHRVAVGNYLGTNPAESARIATLPPVQRGIELARLEQRLAPAPAAAQPKPRMPSAPPPVPTVGARAAAADGYRDDMTQAEYRAWRERNRARG